MRLLSSQKLEKELASGALHSWEKVKYLILTACLLTLSSPLYIIKPIYGQRQPTLNSLVSSICWIALLVVTYKGIRRCYLTNKSIDDKDFIERYTILSVPMTIKLMIVMFIFLFSWMILYASLRNTDPAILKRLPMLITISGPIIIYAYYIFLNKSFVRFGMLDKPYVEIQPMLKEKEGIDTYLPDK